MYISPQIWNLVEGGDTIVYAYVDNKSDDFMKFESTEDILKWIDEDSIIIKLIGKEKVDVIRELYSGALEGVAGEFKNSRTSSRTKSKSLKMRLRR